MEESHREPKTLQAGNHCSQQLLFLNIGCSPYLPAGAGLLGVATADAALAFSKGASCFDCKLNDAQLFGEEHFQLHSVSQSYQLIKYLWPIPFS